MKRIRSQIVEVFGKYGYSSMAQVARAAIEKGLVSSKKARSLSSFYSQIVSGARSIPDKHARVFMELSQNDPEMVSILSNLKKGTAEFYLDQTLNSLYGQYKQRFLRADYFEKLRMLTTFIELVNDKKGLENKIE